LVNSVRGVLTPKFSNTARKRYFSFGISRPCVGLDWSLAKGTVIFVSDAIDILLSPNMQLFMADEIKKNGA
jgi:hypothetical protein